MATKFWVVRVVLDSAQCEALGSFIECLGHAGLLTVHSPTTIDIRPHAAGDSTAWAEMEAKRMASFGYNAVAAPAWPAHGE